MSEHRSAGPLDVLERFRKPRPRPGERCELCGTEVAEEHSHVVNLRTRSLMCACRPCYLLFLPDGSGGRHYKAVPERVVALPPSSVTRAQWDDLQIPVGVAFFFFSTTTNEVHGFYPGPAGATESLLPLDVWEELRAAEPIIASIEPDVEALLVRADGAFGRTTDPGADPEGWVVPIDACYELVGYLRMQWRGFDGGAEVRRTVEEFFEGVTRRGAPPSPSASS